jgi:hypothetical protein
VLVVKAISSEYDTNLIISSTYVLLIQNILILIVAVIAPLLNKSK